MRASAACVAYVGKEKSNAVVRFFDDFQWPYPPPDGEVIRGLRRIHMGTRLIKQYFPPAGVPP